MSVTAAAAITMPAITEAMEEGLILEWLAADGSTVELGDELVEIETDKASLAWPSPQAGVLSHAALSGDTVRVGELIAWIGPVYVAVEGTTVPDACPSQHVDAPRVDDHEELSVPARRSDVRASPIARRIAHELGVDLSTLVGSGPGGRVVKDDVRAASDGAGRSPIAVPTPPAPESPNASTTLPRGVPLTRVQTAIARRMTEAKTSVPEFTISMDVEMGEALALRRRLKDAAGSGIVPSVNDVVVKASACALREHPLLNSSLRDGFVAQHKQIGIGVAVAAAGTLLVPVVRDADTLTLRAVAQESRRLADRARAGDISPGELAGGTFTVSNLGMFGVSSFTAIVNVPQSAILAVGAARPSPVEATDGGVRWVPTATLTLTCDHRVVYGADAARFLQDIRKLLESPYALVA